MTFDCARPYEVATFWRDALGLRFHPETDEDEDDEFLLQGDTLNLLFMTVPEGKTVKNRLHLDVTASPDSTREKEVERLLGLGATIFDDLRKPDGSGWVTMLDPEGNEFCVCRAEHERR
ncbi:VOC family protein [Streptosporangium sp. NPDC050855]|uniref:VOC family protein n=1 Tax=Streptosporangium sp. NPDC050855 TaxID=3366194 RepID=UPI0037A1A66A